MLTIRVVLPKEIFIHIGKTVGNLLLTLAEVINYINSVLHGIHISLNSLT